MKKNKNLYAVILAGGSGTRFWPRSRQVLPKQFLPIVGRESLFQKTLQRIRPKIDGKNVFIVTNRQYARIVRRQTVGLRIPTAQILLEPQGKNTAPAICWAAERIFRRDPQAVMVVLPSDHLIRKNSVFLNLLSQAVRLAGQDQLVTFGIKPQRPETGYGYLQVKPAGRPGQKFYKVFRFIEKPDRARAQRFIKKGGYLWNSGMFVWKAGVVLEAFRKYQPRIYQLIKAHPTDAGLRKVWGKLPAISVDYGILEMAANVGAVAGVRLGWSDLGSWESLVEVLHKDSKGNINVGEVIAQDCRDTAVFADKRLIAAVGLKDMIIVDSPDALLVCRRDVSQKVRDVVAVLKKSKRDKV